MDDQTHNGSRPINSITIIQDLSVRPKNKGIVYVHLKSAVAATSSSTMVEKLRATPSGRHARKLGLNQVEKRLSAEKF